MLIVWKIQYCGHDNSFRIDLQTQDNSKEILIGYFTYFFFFCKLGLIKGLLEKKNHVRRLALSYTKAYYKGIGFTARITDQQNRIGIWEQIHDYLIYVNGSILEQ